MSITRRPYRGGGWEVDITLPLPDGSRHRERKRVSQCSKSAARRWAEDRERYLLQHGPPTRDKEVPTLAEFAPRFINGHARANRHKPSGIATTESIAKWHLVPTRGAKRLDAITNEQVQNSFRLELTARSDPPDGAISDRTRDISERAERVSRAIHLRCFAATAHKTERGVMGPRERARKGSGDEVPRSRLESGLRGSNPSNWLGKPGHYHYAKPAITSDRISLRAHGSRLMVAQADAGLSLKPA
jgi:hypothetical protein